MAGDERSRNCLVAASLLEDWMSPYLLSYTSIKLGQVPHLGQLGITHCKPQMSMIEYIHEKRISASAYL